MTTIPREDPDEQESVANGKDHGPRIFALEEWRHAVEDRLFPELASLKRIAMQTADKADDLISDVRVVRTIAQAAKDEASAARLEAREAREALPPMRAKLSSQSSEIEATIRDAKGELVQLAKDAAKSSDPKAIEGALTAYFERKELTQYRDWKRTVAAVAKKITWGLVALAGAGVVHAIRLEWHTFIHH
jgi:hypothetical protein